MREFRKLLTDLSRQIEGSHNAREQSMTELNVCFDYLDRLSAGALNMGRFKPIADKV